MRKVYEVIGAAELIKSIKPVYTEVHYLCLKPRVVLVQSGNKYFIAEMNRRTLDYKEESIREIPPKIYASFYKDKVIKSDGIKFNSYHGVLEDGRVVDIMELLENDEGKYFASVIFSDTIDYNNFKKPTFLGDEVRTVRDFQNRGIILQKGLK